MAVYYDPQVLTTQMFYGVVGNWVVAQIKKTKLLPFINASTPKLNRAIAIIVAAISALGIEHNYSYSADGVFTLTLSGLTLWAVYEHAKQFVIAYIAQQIPYHVMKPTDATATATATVIGGPPALGVGVVQATAGAEPPTMKGS